MLKNRYNILYINLAKSIDRNIDIKSHLKDHNLEGHRINAIDGRRLKCEQYRKIVADELDIDEYKLEPEYWLNRSNFNSLSRDIDNILPRVGCFLSHIKVLLYAQKQDYDGVCIFEDDVIIKDSIHDELVIPDNTDIMYLGGIFSFTEPPSPNDNPTIRINNLFKLFATSAYIIPTREKITEILNILYSIFNEGKSRDKHKDWRSGHIKLRALSIDRFFINYFQKL